MPRFYFNVHDGVSTFDEEGTELAGLEQAREQAVDLAGGLIRDGMRRLGPGSEWHMNVTDHNGLVLYRLDFSISRTAATQFGQSD